MSEPMKACKHPRAEWVDGGLGYYYANRNCIEPPINFCPDCGTKLEKYADCYSCGDLGWLLIEAQHFDGMQYEIERCDSCRRFDNDLEAGRAAATLLYPFINSLRKKTPDDE